MQKTLEKDTKNNKMQSVFMANVECQSTQIFFFVTDFESRAGKKQLRYTLHEGVRVIEEHLSILRKL